MGVVCAGVGVVCAGVMVWALVVCGGRDGWLVEVKGFTKSLSTTGALVMGVGVV